jgi:enoyl-CoA hydratase/carnithine racemase
VSIAKIRGRTRGIGNEFVLACDMRFAPAGKAPYSATLRSASDWSPAAARWNGSRAIGRPLARTRGRPQRNDFDADIAELYGWVNRTLDDDDLDALVDALGRRLASFDREALAAGKAQVNRLGMPTRTSFNRATKRSYHFWRYLCAGAPGQAPQYRLRSSERLELNFGRYLPALGQADDRDADAQSNRSSSP